jgi:transposase
VSPECSGCIVDDFRVTRTGVISDELWAVLEPVLPSDVGRRGKRWADHRRVLEGIVWRFRVGAPWRDLPVDFGPWQTVWKRHFRWSTDGTYAAMLLAVQEAFGSSGSGSDCLVRLISVDSTSVRAHQHAAGARHDGLAARVTGGTIELQESSA